MARSRRLSVLNFTEDGKFWGFNQEDLHKLAELELPSFEAHEAEAKDNEVLCEGDLCLVKCDGVWKRGKIVSLLAGQHGTRAEIFLIDRALATTRSLRSCYPLPVDLCRIAPLANLYSLKGLQPCSVTAGHWSEHVFDFLKELNGGNTLEVELEAGNLATLYWMVGDVKVNFNECLLHANLATPSKVESDLCLPLVPVAGETSGDSASHSVVSDVFVEGGQQLSSWSSLEASLLPASVQKGLLSLGFKLPTVTQAHAWPYIWEGCNVVFISPSGTGKTLSYLLPLLTDVGTFSATSQGPMLLVVVGTSWHAKSAQIQTKRILQWMSAEKSLRCCCTYMGIEAQAIASLINGVDVVIGTPPSILRLFHTGSLLLKTVTKLVLDDVSNLFSKFDDGVHEILSQCGSASLAQIVITALEWSPLVNSLISTYIKQPVLILISALEAIVRAGTDMKMICWTQKDRSSSVIECLTSGPTVICTSSSEEACEVQQVVQLNNWPCVNVVSSLEPNRIKLMLKDSGVIVVSDEMLDDVLCEQLQISHLLHYSLPQSKQCFKRRLSLLYPSLTSGDRCQCTVVVTEQDQNRSAMFVALLKRTSQLVPKALQEMANNYQKEKEELRSCYDICYHLKAWGTCNMDKCPSLHKPMKCLKQCGNAPPPLILPPSGAVEVKVCHVSNATRLWVNVVKHYPQGRGGQCVAEYDPAKPLSLTLSLAQFYSNPRNTILEEDIREGVYCALEDGGSYFRVRVLKFSHPLGFCFPHKEKARVRLIDYGNVQIVDLNQLLVLPNEFLSVPAQVAEVFLCGVRPAEMDHDWCEEAVELSRNMLEGEVLFGVIAAQHGQTLWLDPVEHRVSLSGIRVSTALCNPSSELVKAGFAEQNSEHLLRLNATLSITTVERRTDLIRWSSLPHNEDTEVHISAVYSPSNFHVQMIKNHTELDSIEGALNSSQVSTVCKSNLREGDPCCAQFPLDDRWYRGLIHNHAEEQSEIIFIDYGDCEWVPTHKIQPIDQAMLELPAQGIKCSLAANDVAWPNDSGDVLWDMTRNANLTARATGMAVEGGAAMVTLSFSESGKSVYESLLEKLQYQVSQPLPTGLIEEVVTALLGAESEQLPFARILESLVICNPRYVVRNFLELSPLFDNIDNVEDIACLHILKGVSASMYCIADSLISIHWTIGLLQKENSQIVVATLQIIKLLLSLSRSLLPDEDVIHCLVSLLSSGQHDVVVAENVFDIILLLSKNHLDILGECLAQVCCRYVLREGPSHTCLLLLDILAANEKSSHTMIKSLPVQDLMESEQFWSKITTVEQISILVNILWMLSSDCFYRDQLYGCSIWEKFQGHSNIVVMALLSTRFERSSDFIFKATRLKEFGSSKSTGGNMIICPHVLWSQQKSSLLLAIQLRECSYDDIDVKFEERSVSFRAHLKQQLYGFDLTPAESIAYEECGFLLTTSEVLISLQKKSPDWWPALMDKTRKLPMFSVDFNRCHASSSDEEIRKEKTVIHQHTTSLESSTEQDDSSEAESQDFLDFRF